MDMGYIGVLLRALRYLWMLCEIEVASPEAISGLDHRNYILDRTYSKSTAGALLTTSVQVWVRNRQLMSSHLWITNQLFKKLFTFRGGPLDKVDEQLAVPQGTCEILQLQRFLSGAENHLSLKERIIFFSSVINFYYRAGRNWPWDGSSITRQYSGYMLMPFLPHDDDDEVDGDDVDDDGVEKSAQHCQGWWCRGNSGGLLLP